MIVTTLIILFLIGYLAIALEHPIKIDKTASALLLGMLMWVIYALGVDDLERVVNVELIDTLGEITQTLFFLIGAMTIVELIDVHNGFRVITDNITSRNKKKLLWVICITTFFLSAVLDNLTTSIVMVMLLRKIIKDQQDRWLYAGMVVIAANTGGAWSPIGDITTIMLWVKGNVTANALIMKVLLPSIVAMVIPVLMVTRRLKGDFGEVPTQITQSTMAETFSKKERISIFCLGIVGLLMVPIFKSVTHLPPFIGMLLVLGIIWVFIECYYNSKVRVMDRAKQHRIPRIIARIDMPSILFFLGILMAVNVLQLTGVLGTMAAWLDDKVHNIYIINFLLGVLSSIVDNVPLVAGAIGMYPVEPDALGYAANFVVDGPFWEFLSYCAGVGGSLLIIGSAAGVIAMGLEKINFGWYMRHITFPAFMGYLGGSIVYILECLIF